MQFVVLLFTVVLGYGTISICAALCRGCESLIAIRQFGGLGMATMAQIQANRSNAQKSTGPRTPEGKERASQNALKHGLLAREAVIQGEDPAEFELYREQMLQELAPAGAVEAMLAERVVGLSWRLRRAERLQNAAFAALDEGEPMEWLEDRIERWKQIKRSSRDRGGAAVLDGGMAASIFARGLFPRNSLAGPESRLSTESRVCVSSQRGPGRRRSEGSLPERGQPVRTTAAAQRQSWRRNPAGNHPGSGMWNS